MTREILLDNIHIFFALLRRDMKVLFSNIRAIFLDNIGPLVANVISFGYLYPILGMHNSLIGPTYLGMMVVTFFTLGQTLTTTMAFDLEGTKYIDYHMSLPLPKKWLFLEYVIYSSIKLSIIILPLTILGILLLGKNFQATQTNWPLFIGFFLISALFFSLFFLTLSFHYSLTWILDNIWSRRLNPLFCLGGCFFVWKRVYDFSKILGIVFLLNPITYVAEGFRSSLIGGAGFLPLYLCFGIISLFIILMSFTLAKSIHKRLDPV